MIYLRDTEYRHAKPPRICAVVARTIFMSRKIYYADSICPQANWQPFINRSIEVKKAMQNFLLILAVSELDMFLMQISIIFQCETYLQVTNKTIAELSRDTLLKCVSQD